MSPTKILYVLPISLIRASCAAHLIIPDLISPEQHLVSTRGRTVVTKVWFYVKSSRFAQFSIGIKTHDYLISISRTEY